MLLSLEFLIRYPPYTHTHTHMIYDYMHTHTYTQRHTCIRTQRHTHYSCIHVYQVLCIVMTDKLGYLFFLPFTNFEYATVAHYIYIYVLLATSTISHTHFFHLHKLHDG